MFLYGFGSPILGGMIHQRAAILAIGDELTLGQTVDTNSAWISDQLTAMGIVPVEHVTVPDSLEALARVLRRLSRDVDLIIATGGLGPTLDDLTRQAVAMACDDSLVEDRLSLIQIETYFAGRGRPMPELNRVQARRPARAIPLTNEVGTAPGLFATILQNSRSCDVFCLPGPPGEMHPMFRRQVLPRLRPAPGRTVRTRVLHCYGIGESHLATLLGPLMARDQNPLVGTTASGGVVSCRIRYDGALPAIEADARLDEIEGRIRRLAGAYLFSDLSPSLAAAVISLLRTRSETLSVVESCTGGLLGTMLTEVPGASSVFVGGLLTYTNEAKATLAGVDASLFEAGAPGAVSREVVSAMARGGLARLGTTHTLAISGIAGPGGGSAPKPVGTVFIARASAGEDHVDCREFRMTGDRAAVRDWAAKSALAMLRLHLIGQSETRLLREV